MTVILVCNLISCAIKKCNFFWDIYELINRIITADIGEEAHGSSYLYFRNQSY